MKLALRFVVPLLLILGLVIYASAPFVGRLQEKWFTRDLDVRSRLISALVSAGLESLYSRDEGSKSGALLTRVIKEERLFALGICDQNNRLKLKTELFPVEIKCAEIADVKKDEFFTKDLAGGKVHVGVSPVPLEDESVGRLVVVHDMSFIKLRSGETRGYFLLAFMIFAVMISAITIIIAQLSWRGWLSTMRNIVRGFQGDLSGLKALAASSAYTPIFKDLRKLVRELEAKRTARDEATLTWTPRTLKEILHDELSGEQVIVVSNREPFIHNRIGDVVEIQTPASGLVTALEPVMEACSGTWIAHGTGTADKEFVDRDDKVRVPPDYPTYSLKRVWLTKEEEQGFYFGFANEGLWPLCHIAHTRPIFRTEDFEYYKEVNERFARAVIKEANTDEPVILIQDYHFALLPAMIRKVLPRAVIITFWHIPWPNPEVFSICPWREELLEGLLGSSIVGFHTQFHCNNFLDTADRFLESRIDREDSAISHLGNITGVRPYPISIEWPPRWLKRQISIREAKVKVRQQLGIPAEAKMGIGVDRLDYTKGIIERFQAVEVLLKTHPEWIGQFTFVQIAAPSRESISTYRDLGLEVRRVADEINKKYGTESYKPIVLKIQHHEPPEVYTYFRASDVCYVSSLHDGMNLVAKEFVASREDERGVLILSSFTGASRELLEALIVNPYNLDQVAETLHFALTMSEREQIERMKSMRSLIREYNVYRWAGRMLLDAATIRKRNKFSKRIHRLTALRKE